MILGSKATEVASVAANSAVFTGVDARRRPQREIRDVANGRGRIALQESSPNGDAFHEFLESWQWLGRSGTPEEVGYTALFLASPLASFITGATLLVSGGMELGMGTKQPFENLIRDRDDG